MGEELLHDFDREVEVTFEREAYLVRDNGAVLRRSRPQGRRRSWTMPGPSDGRSRPPDT